MIVSDLYTSSTVSGTRHVSRMFAVKKHGSVTVFASLTKGAHPSLFQRLTVYVHTPRMSLQKILEAGPCSTRKHAENADRFTAV